MFEMVFKTNKIDIANDATLFINNVANSDFVMFVEIYVAIKLPKQNPV